MYKDYNYTGKIQEFIVPVSGIYKIELWGPKGTDGNPDSTSGRTPGKGGYTSGNVYLEKGKIFYIILGATSTLSNARTMEAIKINGKSVIRIGSQIQLDSSNDNSIIMVAAGGGDSDWAGGTAGNAGGLIGYPNSTSHTGGTQIEGESYLDGYHGGNAIPYGVGRGGSSSYISGHTGCVAIKSNTDITPKTGCETGTTDNSCSIHYSDYKFTDTVMIDGAGYSWTNVKGSLKQMPNPNGGYYASGLGHSGNGYARITYLSNQ